ncbi:serine hydrolase domain-containing protein [Rheinheimera baltica]|uniref:serine hydrolase domain-containing protein n=1 Tax=Rheinheimera baltica TaxID=67576 RepID=UPI00273E3BD3|nr:serine hydrolase domain-containing protein [Rheinheimera baltica]MDP5150883.1 serine hydrolase [Rheinheimera baltica]
MMFYHIRCITLLICSCLALNVFAAQSEYRLLTELQAATAQKNAAEKVDQYLARWASTTLPGLAVAVVKDGELVYSKGVGLANLEYGIPITPDTVFEVASISKQFTAFSILLLADEGRLSIDDEITKYLPELSDLGHKITLRQLLHHTSGLRQQGVLLEIAGWQSDDIATQAQALKLLSMQKDLNFTPGEMFEYSNSGYFLLAEIVSRVSGQSFAEFTQNRIFKPLGMTNSAFPANYRAVIKNKAYSYRRTINGFAKSVLLSDMVGSTGLTTTVKDLAKWAVNFEQPKVGNLAVIQQMKTPNVFNNGETINYAFGQVIDKHRGIEAMGHGGTIAGYRTFLLRMPGEKLSVVVLANMPYLNPLNIAYDIADFYLSALPQKRLSTSALSTETLASYTGDFELLGGLIYSINQDGTQLYLQIMGGAKQPLTHLADNEFSFGDEGRKLRFGAVNTKNVEKITLVEGIYGGQTLVGERVAIPSINAESVNLTEFTGRYYSQELDTTYELVLEDNQLKAKNLRSEVYLTPFDTNTFSGNTGFFLRAKFIRNNVSQVAALEVSGTLINKLKFEKVNKQGIRF